MSTDAAVPAATPDRRLWLLAMVLIAIGAWLRLSAATSFQASGAEEMVYGAYVKFLSANGLTAYPALVERCVAAQEQHRVVMPPMHVTQLIPAAMLNRLTGWDEKVCLNTVAALFSFLMLPLALAFAWRLAGLKIGVAALALMIFAPTQLFMARHAGVDGIVAFWAIAALWALWECLQRPANVRWMLTLAAALTFLVITKENSIYILAGCGVLVLLNRWLDFGTVSRGLLIAIASGLAAGYVILIILGGGFDVLSVLSSEPGPYAIATGDGPWHRYLFDLATVSPLVLIFALTMCARLNRESRPQLFLAIFLAITYAALASEPYGMNLRFANFWDFPLRFLAVSAAFQLFGNIGWRPALATSLAVALLALSDLHQYQRIFVARAIDDPTTPELLRAEDIVKSGRP